MRRISSESGNVIAMDFGVGMVSCFDCSLSPIPPPFPCVSRRFAALGEAGGRGCLEIERPCSIFCVAMVLTPKIKGLAQLAAVG